MNLFRRSATHYGKTPQPETPYQRAAQVWDERIGSARVQARNWRYMAFGSLILAAGFAGALVWQSARGTVVPWVALPLLRVVEALREAKTIAVVGLDSRTTRSAYQVATYLQEQGYHIVPVPVQQSADEVLGERTYVSLRDIPEKVDIVDVFVRSEHTDSIVDDAIAIGAGVVWLQLGVRNDVAIKRARMGGLLATQDRCTLIEHRRHIAN